MPKTMTFIRFEIKCSLKCFNVEVNMPQKKYGYTPEWLNEEETSS